MYLVYLKYKDYKTFKRCHDLRVIDRILAIYTTVLISIGPVDGIVLFIKEYLSRLHVIWKKTDINLGRDELHGYIIADPCLLILWNLS